MPLHVYMYAKPPDKVVRINDAYFLANTKLEDTEQCRRILRIIDQAEYCSEKTFIGRDKSLGALFTDNLSTGAKTLLNISQHRDLCFDTIECGNNALTLLMGFTEGQAVLHPGVVWDQISGTRSGYSMLYSMETISPIFVLSVLICRK